MIRRLLDSGVNINSKTGFYNNTPLMVAARYGRANVVDLLLQQNINVEHPANHEETVIRIPSEKGSTRNVELLLTNRASLKLMLG